MSPFSGTVLGAAAVVASPALWASLVVGSMPADVAMTRYLIAVGACWLVVSLVVDLAFPSAAELATAATRDADQRAATTSFSAASAPSTPASASTAAPPTTGGIDAAPADTT